MVSVLVLSAVDHWWCNGDRARLLSAVDHWWCNGERARLECCRSLVV